MGSRATRGSGATSARPRSVSISADPEALEVSYDYRYVETPGGPHEESVTLQLTFEDGTYLIDGEA